MEGWGGVRDCGGAARCSNKTRSHSACGGLTFYPLPLACHAKLQQQWIRTTSPTATTTMPSVKRHCLLTATPTVAWSTAAAAAANTTAAAAITPPAATTAQFTIACSTRTGVHTCSPLVAIRMLTRRRLRHPPPHPPHHAMRRLSAVTERRVRWRALRSSGSS